MKGHRERQSRQVPWPLIKEAIGWAWAGVVTLTIIVTLTALYLPPQGVAAPVQVPQTAVAAPLLIPPCVTAWTDQVQCS